MQDIRIFQNLVIIKVYCIYIYTYIYIYSTTISHYICLNVFNVYMQPQLNPQTNLHPKKAAFAHQDGSCSVGVVDLCWCRSAEVSGLRGRGTAPDIVRVFQVDGVWMNFFQRGLSKGLFWWSFIISVMKKLMKVTLEFLWGARKSWGLGKCWLMMRITRYHECC